MVRILFLGSFLIFARAQDAPQLDPGLLQAVLADPVLLQAVDPRVLQAVLVSAAAVNIDMEQGQGSEISEFEELEFSDEDDQQALGLGSELQLPQPQSAPAPGPNLGLQAGHKFGSAFSPAAGAGQLAEARDALLASHGLRASNSFPAPTRQGKLGGAFNDLGEVAEKSPEFGELAPNEPRKPNFFTGLRDLAPQFPGLPQFGGNKNNKSPARKTFGAPFGQSPQVIGPIGPQNRPSITNNFNNNAETDVEIFSQDPSSGRAEKLVVPSAGGLTEDSVLSFLRDNPGLLQQLDRLQLPAPAKSERQILPPVIPPGPGTPGVCSLVTANGIPCDPGLAYSPLTGSCEWPDTLIETGCNPEVVTGFGPCPQHIEDPALNPAQIYGWPYPKFPVTPDVVQAYNFDAVLAKKYFIVCVPTVYDKLFPRLICCPEHEFFDPFHVDGCVHPLPPPPPPPLAPQYLPGK